MQWTWTERRGRESCVQQSLASPAATCSAMFHPPSQGNKSGHLHVVMLVESRIARSSAHLPKSSYVRPRCRDLQVFHSPSRVGFDRTTDLDRFARGRSSHRPAPSRICPCTECIPGTTSMAAVRGVNSGQAGTFASSWKAHKRAGGIAHERSARLKSHSRHFLRLKHHTTTSSAEGSMLN